MAFAATSQILHDGVRNVVMQFTGIADGAVGETNVVKVDVSELNPPARLVSIRKITYNVAGGVLQLLWAADTPVPFLLLEGQNVNDYARITAMPNGGGDTANGDILFTTLGFDAGANYSVLLEMVKTGAP